MAGGTWELQNKIQPGIYINFKSSPSTLATVGERGVVAIAKELDWGDEGEINTITSINDVYTKLGYDISDERMKFAQQIFRGSNRTSGASRILVYRLPTTGSVQASATVGEVVMTARYPGVRGNSISVIITPDVDTAVAEPDSATVTFTLVDPENTNAPVPDAAIKLQQQINLTWQDYPGGSATTDASGVATFNDIPAGTYQIILVTAPSGFDSATFQTSPTEFTVVTGGGAQDWAVNATIVQTGGTATAPSTPTNPTNPVADTDYAVYRVETIVDGVIQSSQTVGNYLSPTDYQIATIGDLTDNSWIVFSGPESSPLTATAGITLLGGANGTASVTGYSSFLTALEPLNFSVLCYDGTDATTKISFINFIKRLGYENGRYSQLVLANYPNADEILIISVKNGYSLTTGEELTAEQATWWVAGVTSAASVAQSLTYAIHPDGVAPNPVMASLELDNAIKEGSFAFIEEFNALKVLTDINSFTSYEPEKGKVFSKNRTIRVVVSIANDIYETFAKYYIGVVNNDTIGRNLFKTEIIGYLNQLQGIGAIQNFSADDVEVLPGIEVDAIVVNVAVQVTDAVEKVYMTVTVTAEETAA